LLFLAGVLGFLPSQLTKIKAQLNILSAENLFLTHNSSHGASMRDDQCWRAESEQMLAFSSKNEEVGLSCMKFLLVSLCASLALGLLLAVMWAVTR